MPAYCHTVRTEIEAFVAGRIPSALTPLLRGVREVRATGIRSVDAALGGGVPCAGITEVVGTECSGLMSLMFGHLATATQAGSVCALVDVSDAFDPETAAANGVELERLLWVRCGGARLNAVATVEPLADRGPSVSEAVGALQRNSGGGSPHPRSEGREMPQAISAMLQAHGGLYEKQLRREKRAIGTPGAPNRPLSQRSEEREEQVSTDRQPARRGEQMIAPHTLAARCAGPLPGLVASLPSGERLPAKGAAASSGDARHASKPWQVLDQALRVTDLLLQGGGFSVIVLDLGGISAEFALRIPLATWFRFRAACERTGACLLLLTQRSCARSSAELVVRMEPGRMEADGKVMTGVRYHAEVERQRFAHHKNKLVSMRWPPQSERPGQWRSEAIWAQKR